MIERSETHMPSMTGVQEPEWTREADTGHIGKYARFKRLARQGIVTFVDRSTGGEQLLTCFVRWTFGVISDGQHCRVGEYRKKGFRHIVAKNPSVILATSCDRAPATLW